MGEQVVQVGKTKALSHLFEALDAFISGKQFTADVEVAERNP
jgi:hypothetical protein